MTNDCVFCRIVAGELPSDLVYETDHIMAFRDIAPHAPIDVLVIPKEHHADAAAVAAANPTLAGEILAGAAAVAEVEGLVPNGYRVIFNTGAYAGQEVHHVHAHVLGGAPLGPMACLD